MVTQRPYLFPGTVAHNLRFGPKQRGEELPDDQVDELLSGGGLVGYAARNVANLSGGEAQRVSFARSLANAPAGLAPGSGRGIGGAASGGGRAPAGHSLGERTGGRHGARTGTDRRRGFDPATKR
jgi:ABC transporter